MIFNKEVKTTKRLFAIILAAVLVLCLAACGSGSNPSSNRDDGDDKDSHDDEDEGADGYIPSDEDISDTVAAIAAGDYHTVGLMADGTVVATGHNGYDQCDVNNWDLTE